MLAVESTIVCRATGVVSHSEILMGDDKVEAGKYLDSLSECMPENEYYFEGWILDMTTGNMLTAVRSMNPLIMPQRRNIADLF